MRGPAESPNDSHVTVNREKFPVYENVRWIFRQLLFFTIYFIRWLKILRRNNVDVAFLS